MSSVDEISASYLYTDNAKFIAGLIDKPVNKTEIIIRINESHQGVEEVRRLMWFFLVFSLPLLFIGLLPLFGIILRFDAVLNGIQKATLQTILFMTVWIVVSLLPFYGGYSSLKAFLERPKSPLYKTEHIFEMLIQTRQFYNGTVVEISPSGSGYSVKYLAHHPDIAGLHTYNASQKPSVKVGQLVTIMHWEGYHALL
jgi:hypothetical protein